jgi:hypothetical protein
MKKTKEYAEIKFSARIVRKAIDQRFPGLPVHFGQ